LWTIESAMRMGSVTRPVVTMDVPMLPAITKIITTNDPANATDALNAHGEEDEAGGMGRAHRSSTERVRRPRYGRGAGMRAGAGVGAKSWVARLFRYSTGMAKMIALPMTENSSSPGIRWSAAEEAASGTRMAAAK